METFPIVCTACQKVHVIELDPEKQELYASCGCHSIKLNNYSEWLPDELDKGDIVN